MSYYKNFSTRVRASDVYKRNEVRKAVKSVAPYCKGNFEIAMAAVIEIKKGNSTRKKPLRVSYDYASEVVYQMLNSGEI